MPIKVPNNLPAVDKLKEENVFVMTDSRAMTQDIRPLQILILNLMPTKIETETQLTRLLGNTPLQIELSLLQTTMHEAKNVSQEHMISFYKTFDEVRNNYYDGMIITGAPVETMEFEDVEYWYELCEIMDWSKKHVHSVFHVCWGAQAGLYYHYGIKKHNLEKKLSGVYEHHLDYDKGMLFRGFDDVFYAPHSRNSTVYREDIDNCRDLKVIASSDEAGVFAVKSNDDRMIFIMGHVEYDGDTLQREYERDKKAGLDPQVPDHYFPDDDDTKKPIVRWRSCANLLYTNWLNYFVYQSTPYDIKRVSEEDLKLPQRFDGEGDIKVCKFGGTSLADAACFKNVADIVTSDAHRNYVVVSAPGYISEFKRKITDVLIKAADSYEQGDRKAAERYISRATDRFVEIAYGIDSGLNMDRIWMEISREYFGGAGRDYLLSRGEYCSARLLAELIGYDFIDAADIIRFNKDGSLNADKTAELVREVLDSHEQAVVPGFYGADEDGAVMTFSRGGSDITGSIIASAIGASMYENWTDVNGLLLADPSVVKKPLTVPVITYKELREMAVKGTEVLHQDAVLPVEKMGIPINIRCSSSPDQSGTLIVKSGKYYESILDITGISGMSDCAEVIINQERLNDIPGFRQNLKDVLEEHDVKVLSELVGIDSINLVIYRRDIDTCRSALEDLIKDATGADAVSIDTDLAVISVVGQKLSESPDIAVKALEALAESGIQVKLIDQSAGKISMSIGVNKASYISGVNAIYDTFTRK